MKNMGKLFNPGADTLIEDMLIITYEREEIKKWATF